jgi:hypothetical protein
MLDIFLRLLSLATSSPPHLQSIRFDPTPLRLPLPEPAPLLPSHLLTPRTAALDPASPRRRSLASLSSHLLTCLHIFAPKARKRVWRSCGRWRHWWAAAVGLGDRGKGSSQWSTSSVIRSPARTPQRRPLAFSARVAPIRRAPPHLHASHLRTCH